ncbi:MAG: TolC family protein [Bryobacterales bacterium]|nr:TolC family protein [Bryobacterales bacterium]
MRKVGGLLLLLTVAAVGQTDISLREAVDQALRAHPLLSGAESRTAFAKGARTQASLSPNPRLILQTENPRPHGHPSFVFGRDADNFAYLQKTFETYGKRQRRVETADEVVRRAELEQQLLRRQIAGRVSVAYWQAAGAARTHQLLSENRDTFNRIVEYHEIRVREGAMAEADLIRVRLEAQRLAIGANQAMLDSERAKINLLREMGRTEFPALRLTDSIQGALNESPTLDPREAVEARTETKIARAALAVTQSALRLQHANAKPNVELLFGYKRTVGFNTVLGGFQVDLPFSNRNQGNIESATADIRISESALAATEALIRAEVQAVRTEFEIRRREILNFYQPLLDRAEETYRIAEAAYREGGSDLLRLLDAQRVRTEAQISYARALTDLRITLANVAITMGVEP